MIAGKQGAARRGLTRWAGRAGLLVALGVLLSAPATAGANVASPLVGHAYRHGFVPTRTMAAALGNAATAGGNLRFGGGISGVGVTDGPPKVYLVFFGSQWGTIGTNAKGDTTLSGDPKAIAPYVQEFMKGLGTGGELWSGVMTQYCQGVATGATSCPSSSTFHVGYPTGGALAGVWVDESVASATTSSGHRLGLEAVHAAAHFGNTTSASNRNVQYVIISPHGTNPDNYKTQGFCAWHDYTGDTTLSGGAVSSPYGALAFTNMPYITDVGTSCGASFVNSGSAGALDGLSIVEGHEYAETVTDQFPAGGWTDSVGAENGDKCAWIRSGQGASQDLSLTTGSFAVQSTWANDFNGGAGGCEVSHPILTNGGGNTVSVTSPGNQTSTVGTGVSLQIQASDSASGQTLAYSATGLPAGLSINSSSGLISGTPTTAGTSSVTVTASDTTGATGNTSFSWTVNPSSGCTAAQLLGNPGFETGTAAPWVASTGAIEPSSAGEPANSGTYAAWLGFGTATSASVEQKVTLPTGCSNYTFSFWLHIDTASTSTSSTASLKVRILSSAGTLLTQLAGFSNLNAAAGYAHFTYSVAAYAGQTVYVRFGAEQTSTQRTNFVVDDTALNVS